MTWPVSSLPGQAAGVCRAGRGVRLLGARRWSSERPARVALREANPPQLMLSVALLE